MSRKVISKNVEKPDPFLKGCEEVINTLTLHKKITYKHTDIELLQRGYTLNDIYYIRRNMGLKKTVNIHELLAGKYKKYGISN